MYSIKTEREAYDYLRNSYYRKNESLWYTIGWCEMMLFFSYDTYVNYSFKIDTSLCIISRVDGSEVLFVI